MKIIVKLIHFEVSFKKCDLWATFDKYVETYKEKVYRTKSTFSLFKFNFKLYLF